MHPVVNVVSQDMGEAKRLLAKTVRRLQSEYNTGALTEQQQKALLNAGLMLEQAQESVSKAFDTLKVM